MTRRNPSLEVEVRDRAHGHCEYCQFPDTVAELPFHIDHIIAKKHGGSSEPGNLAWSCFSCNLRKGANIAGIDPESGELSRWYHPRKDDWSDNFCWDDVWLVGKTPVGRSTVATLNINHTDSVAVRRALQDEAANRSLRALQ